MSNPFDPKVPLYEGQALAGQQFAPAPLPVAPPPGGISLHFLEGAGNLALAAVHFFSGSSDDEEGDEEAPRRAPRRSSARVGAGSCCRRPVSK